MFTNVIHNKESVEALGKDYGIKGADGTGPWCFDIWQPRTEIVLKRHDAYKWGPSMYKNKGPVKFEKLVIKIVPEDSSRVAAMMAGQFDITHQFPGAVHHPGQGGADADRDRRPSRTSSCSISASRRRGRWWPTSACARP